MNFFLKKYLGILKRYVELVVKDNTGKQGFFLFRCFLMFLSIMYGGVVKLRSDLFEKNFLSSSIFPCKTISVGNLVVGGVGKTPFTIYLASLMKDFGLSVVVISRGYGGALERKGCFVSDGVVCFETAFNVGDEPYLIAQLLEGIPVVIGKDKFKVGMRAIKAFNPDVMIFDDAFQHLKIKCDLNLVLVDSLFPFGNGFMLPRGILREPISALRRASAVIFTRNFGRKPDLNYADLCSEFSCSHKLVLRKIVADYAINDRIGFRNKIVIAVSGLADNSQFHRSLLHFGFLLKGKVTFSDHHKYNIEELDKILVLSRQISADFIVTTDKDYVKISDKFLFPVPLLVFGVDIEFGADEAKFIDFMSKFVAV